MSPKVSVSGRVIRRWKETTKNGKELFYIAISDEAEKFPNVIKIKARSAEEIADAKKGEKISATCWVNGREWTNAEGKISYFTDFSIIEYTVIDDSAKADGANDAKDDGASSSDPEELPF